MLAARGVSRRSPVCLDDTGKMLIATQSWWKLVHVGSAKVRVLQGGWESWDKAGFSVKLVSWCPFKAFLPLDMKVTRYLHITRPDHYPHQGWLIPTKSFPRCSATRKERRWVLELSLLMRETPSTSGEPCVAEDFQVLSLSRTTAQQPDTRLRLRFRPVEELCIVLKDAGLLPSTSLAPRRIITYCNRGVASTCVAFAVAQCGV
jgi:hypothetical protein